MGYITEPDLIGAATQYVSAQGTEGVDFSLYTSSQLRSLIARASAQIDAFCRQSFALTNIQERYMGRGTNMLRLRRYPLAQIPDSVFGGSGTVSQSLVCDTTTTALGSKGDTSVHVAETSNFLPGQYLQWADSTAETGIEITAVSVTSGVGILTLKSGLAYPHASGARVAVNTIDYMQIVLPGQSFYPIPIQQLVVDGQKGMLINYTPLMFQNLGYATIFPNMLPLLTRYTAGFLAGQVPIVLQEVTIEQCRRIALKNANPGPRGLAGWKIDDQSASYHAWKPVPLDGDLQDALGPFRRNIGMT